MASSSRSRSSRGKKLRKAVVKCVAKAIQSEAKDGGLSAKVLCDVAELPQLELYPERKKLFLEIVQTECISEIENIVNSLCQTYSVIFLSCHSQKDGYMKLQIKWHDFIRSVAAFVFVQCDSDAQVLPESDDDCDTSTSPVTNAWLSIVMSVKYHDHNIEANSLRNATCICKMCVPPRT